METGMERQYKDSGIEWIGRIPKGWNYTKLFNLCTIKGRIGWNGLRSDEFKENSYAYLVTGQDFRSSEIDWSKCYQIDKERYDEDPFIQLENGDLLITKDGTIGKIAKVSNMDKPACLNSGIFVMKQRNRCFVQNYLYWYLVSPLLLDYNSYINSGGTTIMHLYQNVFERFHLLIPTIEEQQRIADYLDKKCGEIDSLISLQEQMIAQLTDYKQSVITEAVTKGLDPKVELIPSGIDWIGDYPKHWKICKIKHCLKQENNNLRVGPFGSALAGNDFKTEGYWVYNQRSVLDNNFSTNDTFVDEEKYFELKSFEVLPGDVLITTRGSIGKIAVVPDNAPKGILHPCIIRFVIDETKYDIALLKHIFNGSEIVLNQMRNQSNSTTIDVLYSYVLKNLVLTLPPLDEQRIIATYLNNKCAEIDALIALKQQKIETLKDYKKSLIYEAVTGKMEIV